MPGDPLEGLDLTSDLNGQSAGVVPSHGDAVPEHRQPPPSQTPASQQGEAVSEAGKPSPSLRDTLSDAFKGKAAPEAGQPPEGAEGAGQTENKGPDLVKVGERWHRRDGSFASNEDIAAYQAVQSGQAAPAVLPSWVQSMTAVEREQFTSLPAETRQWVERTMEGVNQQASQFAEYNLIEQVIGPRRQGLAADGMTMPAYLGQLLALSDFAGKDPAQFVMWFSDQHRLDLDALLDQREAQQAAAPSDPALQGLQQEIAALRNAFNGYTNVNVGQQHAQNVQRVQQFQDEKDADGNLLHPHFPEVADAIVQHIGLLRQQQPYLSEPDLLNAAYDFATYNNPAIREKMQQESLKVAQDRAAAEAARARSVGVSINGGPAGDTSHAPNNANRTLRDELLHAYQQSTLQ